MKNIMLLCKTLLFVLFAILIFSCDDLGDKEDESDPEGTMISNISDYNASIGMGTDGHIAWWKPDNFFLQSVSVVCVGKVKGLGDIKTIPSLGWSVPTNNYWGNTSIACEAGYGYVVKCYDYETVSKFECYGRMYVVGPIVSTSGGIIGAKVKYQWPFNP